MDRRELHLSLLEDLLAAPGSEAGWAAFLIRLCDALHGSAANFIAHDISNAAATVSVTARTDPGALAAYNQHWYRFDPWASRAAAARLQPHSVVLGDVLVSRPEMRRTPFYNDFSRGFDIGQSLAGMIEASPERISCLSINRADGGKAFDRHDAALLDRLMRPLQQALALHRRLAGSELLALHASAVLDRLPHAVLFVGAGGRVLATNRAADELLRARDGLGCEAGQLRAATPELTERLRTALGTVVRARGGAASGAGATVSLPKVSGGLPLSLVVAPLPARRAEMVSDEAVAVIFVTDPDRAAAPDLNAMRAAFGLTAAEADLVGRLARGSSLEESARELGLSVETLRSRLKTIFQKTDTHRQADLIRLVLAVAGPGLHP